MASHRLEHLTHDEWMRPKCSVCSAAREGKSDIPRVEALLAAGARLKPVAEKFGINAYSLRRHWQAVSPTRKTYLKFGSRLSQEALQARVAEERLAVIDHLVLVRNGLHQAFALALAANDYNAIANLARVIDGNVERAARLTGEWKDTGSPHTVTNIAIMQAPGVSTVIAGIARVLSDYPEAKAKVMDFLRTTNGVAALPTPRETIDAVAID